MQLSDVNGVADRLHSAAIHLLRRLRRHDDAMALTPARASALSIMVFGGPVTLGALARAEQVSAPTVTRLVVGMERDGLVRRVADQRDGRVVWLHATSKGERLLHEGRRRRVTALAEDLGALTASERDTLAAAAEILERMLGTEARRGAAVSSPPRSPARVRVARRAR
jgi:DNA-binding MarR family transcriptional regulator